MKIILVQPTSESPSYLKRDYWDVVNTENPLELYHFIENLSTMCCEYEFFDSFQDAKDYLCGINATKHYKQMMWGKLDYLRSKAKTFNWAVV
ncbi:hypothetical protein BBP14_07925 [Limosilactobacillus reuteri]|nr:hypothetical protein BBP13_09445 [Limosilactobacillus reuteri]OCW68398.1 hypothetical protein BBP14_07925 [Limosilactobacillus reuteri]